jgi:DNA-binding NarL/FixJ family response regulator
MGQKEFKITNMNSPLSLSTYPDHARPRVLLVDDSPQVLQDLRLLLELRGEMEIIAEAVNGQKAVRLAADLAPDVVVMDLEMPVMNGYEATRQIKSRLPAPRVVILSVHAGPVELDRARAAGADRFVIKGARYEILLNAVLATDGSPYLFGP